MSELRELYQEVIIDHGRHPRNFGKLLTANRHQEGFNPLCGDKIKLYLQTEKEKIENIQFEGCGCAISMASASLMTETLKNKTISEAQTIFLAFHDLITLGNTTIELGKLTVLSGLKEFPTRVKCATLAWHTLKAALAGSEDVVCTEEMI